MVINLYCYKLLVLTLVIRKVVHTWKLVIQFIKSSFFNWLWRFLRKWEGSERFRIQKEQKGGKNLPTSCFFFFFFPSCSRGTWVCIIIPWHVYTLQSVHPQESSDHPSKLNTPYKYEKVKKDNIQTMNQRAPSTPPPAPNHEVIFIVGFSNQLI